MVHRTTEMEAMAVSTTLISFDLMRVSFSISEAHDVMDA